MINELNDPAMQARWTGIAEYGWQGTQNMFEEFDRATNRRRSVLNCAIPPARAFALVDFALSQGWSLDKCLRSGVGFGCPIPEGLEGWSYRPKIQAVPQLPQLKPLPEEHRPLMRSPWLQSPSQALGMGINARHLRYHYDLWHELRPGTLRGVFTSLVFVTPQLTFRLAPHIDLQQAFMVFAALARASGPAQIFPAAYLYPDARLAGLERTPAAIFADILPNLGSSVPVMESEANRWGTLIRLDRADCHYGFPFRRITNDFEDTVLTNAIQGSMGLPDGTAVRARHCESYVYATHDPRLRAALKMDQDAYAYAYCLERGVITHDGLPFLLPIEMQAAVFAVLLTAWELEMDRPGDLTSYALKTQHAAIRGYNLYQRQEPYYSGFMRLVEEIAKEPSFEAYPLASYQTYPWLGGNLRLVNQRSESEEALGHDFMRSYYLQQLDWSMGVFNLCNTVEFRRKGDIEGQLMGDGLAMHQMRTQWRQDVHLFHRPSKRASFWPNLHPDWTEFDQRGRAGDLPRPSEW
jgi:hypothetical protein